MPRRYQRQRILRAALLSIGLTATAIEHAGASFFSSSWVGPASGSWLTTANWSPARVPFNNPTFSNEFAVTIGQPAGVSVIFNNLDTSIDSLKLSASNGALLINNHTLTVTNADGGGLSVSNNASIQIAATGTLVFNGGTLAIASGSSIQNSDELALFGNVTTQGGGSLVGFGGVNASVNNVNFTNGLTIRVASLGTASANFSLANQSTGILDCDANLGPSQMNVNFDGASSNAGAIRAENGGLISLFSISSTATLTNSGTIEALDGSEVDIEGITIKTSGSGQLSSTGGGHLYVDHSTFDGTAVPFVNKAAMQVDGFFDLNSINNNSVVVLKGTINNSGTITTFRDSTGLFLATNTTLSGAGVLTLGHKGGGTNSVTAAPGGVTFTNSSTINGYGDIGRIFIGSVRYGTLTLNNQSGGLIDSNDSNGLSLELGGVSTNAGTLRASNGGHLQVTSSNSLINSGTIAALNGSSVFLSADLIGASGGVLTSSGSGTISVTGTLDGTNAPIVNSGTLEVHFLGLTAKGTITNNGTILQGSSTLLIDTGLTLNGSGALTISDPAGGSPGNIGAATNAATLTNSSTINGWGYIGGDPNGDGLGSLSVLNIVTGSINANVAGQSLLIQSPVVNNAGVLKTTNGAMLELAGVLTNTGTADVAGGVLVLDHGVSGDTVLHQLHTAWHNGAWDQPGIGSSLAKADVSRRTGVGYRVTGTAYTFQYALYGDADLNNTVDTSDFTSLSQHFNQSSAVWTAGDFNYDGVVNALDFNALATNFGRSLPADVPLDAAELSRAGSLVPEPATWFGISVLVAFARRRRRRHA